MVSAKLIEAVEKTPIIRSNFATRSIADVMLALLFSHNFPIAFSSTFLYTYLHPEAV